jgi:hypothetical protein
VPGGCAVPATSAKQQRFMGSELARAKAGKKTRTGMDRAKLEEMAEKPKRKPKRYGA